MQLGVIVKILFSQHAKKFHWKVQSTLLKLKRNSSIFTKGKTNFEENVACVASVPVRKKSSQTIFRKQARKLSREIVPSISRPNFRAACLRKIVWELFFRTGTLPTQAKENELELNDFARALGLIVFDFRLVKRKNWTKATTRTTNHLYVVIIWLGAGWKRTSVR